MVEMENDFIDEDLLEFTDENVLEEVESSGPNLIWLKALIILLVLLIPAILAVIEALTGGPVQVRHDFVRPIIPWMKDIVNF
jgi:hypothetical protein